MAGIQYENGSQLLHLQAPQDFVIDDYQNIYIADTSNHRVIKW